MVHENGTENSLHFGSLAPRQRVEKVILASAILSTIECRKSHSDLTTKLSN